MQVFLLTYQPYDGLFKQVWLWSEFPYRFEFGSGQDVGIDLVCQTAEDEYCAVQCKCYREDTTISKSDVDSFLSTSGKKFHDGDGTLLSFSSRLWISTTNNWSSHAETALQSQTPPVTRLNLSDLETAPVNWDKLDAHFFGKDARLGKKVARPHQIEAISAAHEYFQHEDRGKLITACGPLRRHAAAADPMPALLSVKSVLQACGGKPFLCPHRERPSIAVYGGRFIPVPAVRGVTSRHRNKATSIPCRAPQAVIEACLQSFRSRRGDLQ